MTDEQLEEFVEAEVATASADGDRISDLRSASMGVDASQGSKNDAGAVGATTD